MKRGKFDVDTYTPQRGRPQDFGPWQLIFGSKVLDRVGGTVHERQVLQHQIQKCTLGLTLGTLSNWKGKQGKKAPIHCHKFLKSLHIIAFPFI